MNRSGSLLKSCIRTLESMEVCLFLFLQPLPMSLPQTVQRTHAPPHCYQGHWHVCRVKSTRMWWVW